MLFDPKPNTRGGMVYQCAGSVSRKAVKTDEATAEVTAAISVEFWGGNAYVKLDDVEDTAFVREGSWVHCEMEVREFKGNQYAGRGRIIAVDGKPIEELRKAHERSSARQAS